MLHEIKNAHDVLKHGESKFINHHVVIINAIEKIKSLNDEEQNAMYQLLTDAYVMGIKHAQNQGAN